MNRKWLLAIALAPIVPIVALSGFLTLAFDSMKETVEAIDKAGLRDKVKIMIGGGQIDDEIRKYAGADAKTAIVAIVLAYEVQQRLRRGGQGVAREKRVRRRVELRRAGRVPHRRGKRRRLVSPRVRRDGDRAISARAHTLFGWHARPVGRGLGCRQDQRAGRFDDRYHLDVGQSASRALHPPRRR